MNTTPERRIRRTAAKHPYRHRGPGTLTFLARRVSDGRAHVRVAPGVFAIGVHGPFVGIRTPSGGLGHDNSDKVDPNKEESYLSAQTSLLAGGTTKKFASGQ